MSIVKPYKGLSRNRLTDLLNEVNGRGRVEDVDFTYGIPTAVTGPNGENTRVTTTPVPGTNYLGPVDVYYTRLPISVVGELPYNTVEPPVINAFPFWIRNILPEINRALGLDLIPDEVVNVQYTEPQDSYTLTINNKSLAWTPSSLTFKAINQPLVTLDDAIPEDTLAGFVPVVGQLPQLIGDALDGFNRAIPSLEDILPGTYDGFDPKWRIMEEEVGDAPLNGFDYTPGSLVTSIDSPAKGFVLTPNDLVNVIGDAFDGFVESPNDLEFAIEQVDGFEVTPNTLDNVIAGPSRDGFDYTPGDLWDVVELDKLDGFFVADTPIDQIVTVWGHDGFDITPGDLQTCLDDSHDGFEQTPGSLETSINSFQDGFNPIIGTLDEMIANSLDGFQWTETAIDTLITAENLDGFVWNEGILYEFIPTEALDGFDLYNTSLTELIPDPYEDGFTVRDTGLIEIIYGNEFDGFLHADGDLDVVIPGGDAKLDGFIFPPTALDFCITVDSLDGFDSAPRDLDMALGAGILNGFVLRPGNIVERIYKDTFEGFGTETFFLADFIGTQLDGFEKTSSQLSHPFNGLDKFGGFTVEPTHLEDIETTASFDGFIPEPNSLDTYLRLPFEQGFEPAPGPLEGHIFAMAFASFVESPYALTDVIFTPDGFAVGDGTVEWIDEFLGGFDQDMTAPTLEQTITKSTFDGFMREPEWRQNLSIVIAPAKHNGFEPAPNNPIVPITFDVVFTKPMQTGFDPVPEWRKSLIATVDPKLKQAIDRADQYSLNGLAVRNGTGFIARPMLGFGAMIYEFPEGFAPVPEWRTPLNARVAAVIEHAKYNDYLISENISGPLDGLEKPDVQPWDGVIPNEFLKGFVPAPDTRIEIGSVVLQVFPETLTPHTSITMSENVSGRIPNAVAPHPVPTALDDIISDSLMGFAPPADTRKNLSIVFATVQSGLLIRANVFRMTDVLALPLPGWDKHPDYTDLNDLIIGDVLGWDAQDETRLSLKKVVAGTLNGSILKNNPLTMPENVSGPMQGWDEGETRIPMQYAVAQVISALTKSPMPSLPELLAGRTEGFGKPLGATIDEWIESTLDGFAAQPEWRTSLITTVNITLNGGALTKNTAVAAADLVSGPLDGIYPMALLSDTITASSLDGFDQEESVGGPLDEMVVQVIVLDRSSEQVQASEIVSGPMAGIDGTS